MSRHVYEQGSEAGTFPKIANEGLEASYLSDGSVDIGGSRIRWGGLNQAAIYRSVMLKSSYIGTSGRCMSEPVMRS